MSRVINVLIIIIIVIIIIIIINENIINYKVLIRKRFSEGAFDAPVRASPSEYCHPFGTGKLEWWGYPKVKQELSYDLEIYVKGHSRSLETEPLDRSYTTYY